MSESVVEVQNLSRRFGNALALDNISFQAEKGLVYGLVGANGAGKTTLIKHLMGLLRCKSGSVSMFGMDPVTQPEQVLGKIGYLSEERDIPDWMSIGELMHYTQAFHSGWDEQYASDLLTDFALNPAQRIKELSRGMRAQVALIAAVAYRPELLILDEPSSGLDAVVRKDILNAIVRTISEDGRTVIFSSHFLEEVERMSDHVTMIQRGQVTFDGSLDTLTGSHHCSDVRFDDLQSSFPVIDGVLSIEGEGRFWKVLHQCPVQELESHITISGGEVTATRNANLEEIFVTRVGRIKNKAIAA